MDRVTANETPDTGDSDGIIAEEVQRLLESPMFIRSPVLSRLLQFLADHRLRGGRAAPKAYAIATEALGRSADFDPAVDSYPRVMVGRLRSLLDRYYADTPWVRRLRVPQGSYEVVVQLRASPPARSADAEPDADAGAPKEAKAPAASRSPSAASPLASGPHYGHWIVGVALGALILFAAWWFLGGRERMLDTPATPIPVLVVSPPSAGDSGESRALARALDGKLRDGLRRFDLVELRSAQTPGQTPSENRADYRLDSSVVRTVEGPVDVTLVLNRVADQRTIWSQQLRLGTDELPEFTAIEPAIARIAGDYGVIVRDQIQRQPDNFDPGFPCLAQFNRMRQMRSTPGARRVEACLRATLEADPYDPVALNALSLLRYGDWQHNRATPAGREAREEARSLAHAAYDAGPNTTAGLFAMARANFYAGNCSGGQALGGAAVALNPYDPDLAGFLGLFRIACGQMAEGEVLLQRSLDLDDSYPGVAAVTLAFTRSQAGDQAAALDILDRMPSPSNMEPQYLMVRAIILARQGDRVAAQRLWRRLLAYTRQPASASPEQVLRQFMITPIVIQRAAAALRDAGVVAAKTAS